MTSPTPVDIHGLFLTLRDGSSDGTAAAELLRAACDPLADYYLGVCHAEGMGVALDPAEAAHRFSLCALRKYAPGQFRWGLCCLVGAGVAKDDAKAASNFQLAADQGYALAQYHLALCLRVGKGVEADLAEAARYLRLAAESVLADLEFRYHRPRKCPMADQISFRLAVWLAAGVCVEKDLAQAEHLYELVVRFWDGPPRQHEAEIRNLYGDSIVQDEAEAERSLRLAADQGNARAQWVLSLCLRGGMGVEQDRARAETCLRMAAEQGYAPALAGLADQLIGDGNDASSREAMRLYRLAFEQGYADAYYSLAGCYLTGQGVSKSNTEMVRYLRLAADQGHVEARYQVALELEKGDDIDADEVEAARYCRLAADAGHPGAQLTMARLYRHGMGIKRDENEADRYQALAAAQGHDTPEEPGLGWKLRNNITSFVRSLF